MSDYRVMGIKAAQQRSAIGNFQGRLRGHGNSRMSMELTQESGIPGEEECRLQVIENIIFIILKFVFRIYSKKWCLWVS